MGAKVKHASECIAFHLGWNMPDVTEGRYQPTRYAYPAIYVCADDYYCCPPAGKAPPKGRRDLPDEWNWQVVGEAYGRTVYVSRIGNS